MSLEPPATVGPIVARRDEIVARVQANLHTADATWVGTAVDAAISYATTRTERHTIGLPDDELTMAGLVPLAERIYLDQFAPNGIQSSSTANPVFDPTFNAAELDAYVETYFRRLKIGWGIG